MRRNLAFTGPVLLFSLCVSSLASGQLWSGILDPSRAVNWSNVGIPGGIPSRQTICTTINASSYGNGSKDATAAIQAGLDRCTSGQTVSLSAGTFLVMGNLTVPSNVTLRGAGANQTILNARGSGEAVISLGSPRVSPSIKNSTAITSGTTQGSTHIVVSSASQISAGSYLMITELNDPSVPVSSMGVEGNCGWCDSGIGWNGTRVAGQIVEVVSVKGTTIDINPPLYANYTRSPLATPFQASKYAGVEDLQIYANNTGYGTNFKMNDCAYCWIKGVESNFADGDHVDVDWSYRGEIRDSYFHDAFKHGPGQHDSSVDVRSKSSGILVENNILRRLHVALMLEWGAAGNVLSYNYDSGDFDANAKNVLMGGLDLHGAHPWFNLLEGNTLVKMSHDAVWGSSSHNTHFRNWIVGTTNICNPLTGRGALGTCWWSIQAIRAVEISQTARKLNSVGNVVGSASMAALTHYNDGTNLLRSEPSIVAPTLRSYDLTTYGYTWGYGGAADTGTQAGDNAAPSNTAFIHGDYTSMDGSITWASGASHTLPASFYRSSQPAWWHTAWGTPPWPAVGPDVTGGEVAGVGEHVHKIPAQLCFENSPSDGQGGIIFNGNACYGHAGPLPAPPTNVSATAE